MSCLLPRLRFSNSSHKNGEKPNVYLQIKMQTNRSVASDVLYLLPAHCVASRSFDQWHIPNDILTCHATLPNAVPPHSIDLLLMVLRERELEKTWRSDLFRVWASILTCFGRASRVDSPRTLNRCTRRT